MNYKYVKINLFNQKNDCWATLLEQLATVVLRRSERIAARELRSGEADTSLAAELTFDCDIMA